MDKGRLEELKKRAMVMFRNAEDEQVLNDVRVQMLGKNGEITQLLMSIK